MQFVSSVLHHFTPLEVTTMVVGYGLVRGIWWCIKQPMRMVDKAFKSEMQRNLHRHVHDRHGGHPLICDHPDCEVVQTIAPDLKTL